MPITKNSLDKFSEYLISKGVSKSTHYNYLYDVKILGQYLKNKEITSETLEEFKKKQQKKFNAVSVKAMICGINSYLEFIDCPYRIEQITVPKRENSIVNEVITKEEYINVLKSIKSTGNDRLYLIVESICCAGFKLSELQFLTVEAVIKRKVVLPPNNNVYLSKRLCEDLLEYCRNNNIFIGAILLTRGGKIPDRANVSREIKSACADTGIDAKKLSTKALREYYFRNFESFRREMADLMDEDWQGSGSAAFVNGNKGTLEICVNKAVNN